MLSRVPTKQVRLFLAALLAVLILLAACSSPVGEPIVTLVAKEPSETQSPTLEPTLPPAATSTTFPDTPTLTLEPTLTPSATVTNIPAQLTQVPRVVQTGIPQVDAMVEAVLSYDLGSRQALVRFVTSGCTTADGLGGPPKCKDEQTEGTLVEYLPLGGLGEGSHALASEMASFLNFETDILYAAYRVSDDIPNDPENPFGAYALIFSNTLGGSGTESVGVLVDDEGYIVRLDYLGGMPPDFYFQQVAADLLDPPPETKLFTSEAAEILVYPPE